MSSRTEGGNTGHSHFRQSLAQPLQKSCNQPCHFLRPFDAWNMPCIPDHFEPGTVVSGFLPIRSEIDLRPLMAMLADRGARLCLPVVVDRETIVFRELVRGAAMVATGFGTSGPGPDAAVLEPEIMLVPLAAFDRRGHRLGYGAGHYDRAIARLHAKGQSPHLIGTGFDCQEVERVPDEKHDVTLAELLTESGLRKFPATG